MVGVRKQRGFFYAPTLRSTADNGAVGILSLSMHRWEPAQHHTQVERERGGGSDRVQVAKQLASDSSTLVTVTPSKRLAPGKLTMADTPPVHGEKSVYATVTPPPRKLTCF